MKKWVIILNAIVLAAITAALVFTIISFSSEEIVNVEEECIAVNQVTSFIYDSCYDTYTQTIFLKVRRSLDTYRVNAFEFSFFDFSEQAYEITDVPNTAESRAYKISAEKNPQNLDVRLNIVKDFSAPICDEARTLFVKYCPAGSQEEGVNISISPLEGVEAGDFIEIEKVSRQESDVFSLSLVDKERIWKSQCGSSWDCSGWEECSSGVQRRSCEDKSGCFIPTGMPDVARYCDGRCDEEWECEWSGCSNGFTTPKCRDVNNCGSTRDIPRKLSCSNERGCQPDISCTSWSECDASYDFSDLIGGVVTEIRGTKRRTCIDNNNCAPGTKEVRACSVGVDIYTRRISRCGSEFVGVYDRLSNDLLARIDEGTEDNPYLNIRLDEGEQSPYCDYCFDGVLSGDETRVDCGGSCELCSEKYAPVLFKKRTTWSNFVDKLMNFFS
jgi:hypothetical protein